MVTQMGADFVQDYSNLSVKSQTHIYKVYLTVLLYFVLFSFDKSYLLLYDAFVPSSLPLLR